MKAKTTLMKRITSILLCLAMVVTMLPAMSQQATAATISNPRIVADSSMKAGQKVTWDCIWFGSYPQTEIVSDKSQCGTVGKGYETSSDYEVNEGLYNSLKNATYDSNGDTTVEGVKYRRLQKSDTTYSSNSSGYYSWSDRTYHYFRYDKIKWRVLNTDGTTALLLADKALDDQRYNTEDPSITWEKSTIRSWLNGYGSSYNLYGTDYTSKNFVNTAFSSSERGAIKSCSVVNDSNIEYGTAGGNNTTDKIFLLSEKEVYKTDTASSYGFVKDWDTYDEARRCKSSTYAKAMGTWSFDGEVNGDTGNCYWWLRSPGSGTSSASSVYDCGNVDYNGDCVYYCFNSGVRAALNINLLSSDFYTYAGTVCSDERVNAVGLDNVKATVTIKASDYTKTSSTKSQNFYIKPTFKTDGKVSYVSGSSKIKVTSSGKVTIPAKYVGKFSITIKTSETASYKKASKKIYVTVKPSKTTLSKLVNLSGRKVKVYWKKNTIGSGYQIQYSRSSSFKSGNKTKTIKSNKTTYTTITSLTKGKTYYFRIRTYKTVSGTKYYSAWSAKKYIKVKK